MSPVRFDYVPGRIEAKFSHDTFDYIDLDIHLTGDTTVITPCDVDGDDVGEPEYRYGATTDFKIYMSSVHCAFGDFIAFLEAIAVGVQRCSFRWDAEGPDGCMSWSRSARGMGTLGIQWFRRGEDLDYGILVDRRQAVGALYGAFRSFVESADYNAFSYEALTLRDAIELTLKDAAIEDVRRMLVALPASEVECLLQRLIATLHTREDRWSLHDWPKASASERAGHPRLVDVGWDGWPVERRSAFLEEILERGVGSWFGANLRAMRSSIIEAMLARGADEKAESAAQSHGTQLRLH